MVVGTNSLVPNNENLITMTQQWNQNIQSCIFSKAILSINCSNYIERMISELKAVIVLLITLIFNLIFCFPCSQKIVTMNWSFAYPHWIPTPNIQKQRVMTLRNGLFIKTEGTEAWVNSPLFTDILAQRYWPKFWYYEWLCVFSALVCLLRP